MDRALRWTLLGCGVGLALAVLGAAWGVRAAEGEAIAEWENSLQATSEDRRLWVESWVAGTSATVRVAAAYPTVIWLASGRPPGPLPFPAEEGAEGHLKRLLDTLCLESGFEAALLTDKQGAILGTGGTPNTNDRDPARLTSYASRDIPSLEVDPDGDDSSARFVQPVRSAGGADLLGALWIRQDALRHLAPALAWRGHPFGSAETFLVESKQGALRAMSSRAVARGFREMGSFDPPVAALLKRLSAPPGPDGPPRASPSDARIAGFSQVRGQPWGIATTVSRAEATQDQKIAVVPKVASAAFAVIAALLGAFAIRERKRARREVEAHARAARLVAAIEHTRDVALFLRGDGKIVEALGATDRIYGVPAASIVGRRLDDLRSPETREASQQAGAGRGGALSEETHLRGDGQPVPVEVSTSPVEGADRDRWSLALVRDVGERRRVEEATRTLVRAVEQSPVSIIVTDRNGAIEYVNPHFCEVSGYTLREVLGQNPRFLKSGKVAADVYDDLWRTINAGRVWHGELVNLRKDGTEFTERASIAPVVDAHSSITHFVAVKEDLTEWNELEDRAKSSEARYLQAQKLEAVGQLAGGIAHDFNNLLCVILGYGQMVADGLGPSSPHAAHLVEIVKAGKAAEALTRQLLAFSRRQVLQPRVLDLNQVLRGVEKMLRRLIGEDVTLVTEYTLEPAVVRVDAGQMEQVLVNLVVNSRDAMPDGGRLTIRTTFESGGDSIDAPGAEAEVGPWVVLSVADTGTGMDAATQARVFEPFFTTKPPGSGTGLGLATVYGIVKQSGGSVGFTSVVGSGTEFHIKLPRLAMEAEADDRAPVDLQSYGGTETILLAEDQAPVRQIVRIWLERRGYSVLEAADGQAGILLAASAQRSIDLLITDVVMPRASGRELADAVRARENVPVIYMSGYTKDVIQQKGLIEPGVRLLEKPLSEATLLRNVREALDGAKRGLVR